MKSRRSMVRAILFVLRLQKSVSISRESRRASSSAQNRERDREPSGHHHHTHHSRLFLNRAESTRHRRRSSQKQQSVHRNSAPGGALQSHRSPSIARYIRPLHLPETPLHFGAFSGLSQPYSIGLNECQRGAPLLTVCAGAAHALASTALLVRQQSLDDHATRGLMSTSCVASTSSSRATERSFLVQRQSSVESIQKKKRNGEGRISKKIKSNMISLMSALIAVENDDDEALGTALKKNLIEADVVLTCGVYAFYRTPWTLLDVALLLKNQKCSKLLIAHGAKENPQQNTWEQRMKAVTEAHDIINERRRTIKQNTSSQKEYEKQVKQWNSHSLLMNKMESTLHATQTVIIDSVKVEATSSTSIAFRPMITSNTLPVVIKYKVEWSDSKFFDSVLGSHIITNLKSAPYSVKHVRSKGNLYFRVSAGTIYGFGPPTMSTPISIEMSSWEELEGKRESRDEHFAAIVSLTEAVDRHRQSLVWQNVFPTPDINLRKKKNGLRELFTASSKFAKNMQSGCYLVALTYCEGKILCTVDDCLPIFTVDESVCTLNREDLQWLLKLSLGWEQLGSLTEANPGAYSNNIALSFRAKVIAAATDMMNALGMKDIGRLSQPVYHENVVFLVTTRFVSEIESVQLQLQTLTVHWMTFDKLLKKRQSCPATDKLTKETVSLMNFFESSQIPLKRGLYVSYLKLHSTLSSIRVVVPDNLPSVLPFVCVRDNPHVTRDEWEWIKVIDENREVRPTAVQRAFHRHLSKAVNTLLHDLDVDPDLVPGHRMLRTEILTLNDDVSLILILPKPEDVCSVPTGSSHHSDACEQRRGCTSISILVFEMIHLSTYHPAFIMAYCRLSIFLEHFLMISQFEQRKCLLENDSKVYKKQCEILAEFQKQLDSIWGNSRWISRIASLARDKSAKCTIPLSRLLAPFEDQTDFGYQSDQSGERPEGSPISRFPRPQSLIGSSSNSLGEFDRVLSLRRNKSSEKLPVKSSTPPALTSSAPTTSRQQEKFPDPPVSGGAVVVYAAYDCGLAPGTSVRLSIASNTTSAEVVALVTEQLAKAAAGRNNKEEQSPRSEEYCLVVVMGVRERRLRDDFALLKLQNPWTKGKLYVRRKESVCSAVQFGNEAAV